MAARPAFALLAAVQLTLTLAISVITVALPAIQRDLGLRRADLVLVTSAYGLSFGGLLLLGDRLADLLGRRRALVLGTAAGGRAGAVTADVTRAADADRLTRTVVARHGRLDVAFNNAGTFAAGPLTELDEATGSSLLAVNLTCGRVAGRHR